MSDSKISSHEDKHENVIIRARPKGVFLYPTLLAALLAGLWTLATMGPGLEDASATPGRTVFFINLLGIAFDFTRGEFVALILFFGCATLGIVLLDERWDMVRPVRELLAHVKLLAHPHLYFMIAAAEALGGTGRIVIHPAGSSRAVVLENVIGVNRIETRIQTMLASLQVKVDTSGHNEE